MQTGAEEGDNNWRIRTVMVDYGSLIKFKSALFGESVKQRCQKVGIEEGLEWTKRDSWISTLRATSFERTNTTHILWLGRAIRHSSYKQTRFVFACEQKTDSDWPDTSLRYEWWYAINSMQNLSVWRNVWFHAPSRTVTAFRCENVVTLNWVKILVEYERFIAFVKFHLKNSFLPFCGFLWTFAFFHFS